MKQLTTTLLWLCFLCPYFIIAQDYIGGGNDAGISISSSNNYKDPRWATSSNGSRTLDGSGFNADRYDAARFLTQATVGFRQSDINSVISLGKEGWIDDQFTKGFSRVLPRLQQVIPDINQQRMSAGGGDIGDRADWRHFSYIWWERNMSNNDLLRHKVATALSEILVISQNSDLDDYGEALAAYYDILLNNAFGNYEDLLLDVTYSPAMGYFLSHANNPKSIPELEQFPDENYARELMQLFTIGLFELNTNGTHKKQDGEDIPTYDNEDVLQYSEIFTGLSYGALHPNHTNRTLEFGINKQYCDMTVPMIMYDVDDPQTNDDEDQHEDGEKFLLRGQVVPAGQTGNKDIQDAVNGLFNHPNVGPFLAYRLIQRMTVSNPSPAYVQRVAEAFNNNGSGVRGDMKAVIKAILLDDEAQSCASQTNDNLSKLKEPMLRYTQFARAIDKTAGESQFIWNSGDGFGEDAGQEILSSPSVFNFFLPIDGPSGDIEDRGLVAPEFKLHDTKFSIGYVNEVYKWTQDRRIMRITDYPWTEWIYWNIDGLLALAEDVEVYINWIDDNVTHGRLSDNTRAVIRNALNQISSTRGDYLSERVRMGMYFALISPEYSIIK